MKTRSDSGRRGEAERKNASEIEPETSNSFALGRAKVGIRELILIAG